MRLIDWASYLQDIRDIRVSHSGHNATVGRLYKGDNIMHGYHATTQIATGERAAAVAGAGRLHVRYRSIVASPGFAMAGRLQESMACHCR